VALGSRPTYIVPTYDAHEVSYGDIDVVGAEG